MTPKERNKPMDPAEPDGWKNKPSNNMEKTMATRVSAPKAIRIK